MPNHKFDLWTHGCSVIVEDDGAPGLEVKRDEWGAKVRQDEGTSNTYHFAIPTGVRLDNETVDLYDAWVWLNVNNNAHVKRVTMRQAEPGGAVLVFDSGEINLTGIRGNDDSAQQHFDVGNRRIDGPLVLSVEAVYHDRGGEIQLRGAGARQME